ncbi:O-antigen ligase family protein [Salinibacterium sp. PAMC 21357]|uniref:O-antigen ligase family protein n=1 Tax=Salinibacterium sp. PAMC 21357 TaxID=1112215 RepID=UPI001300C493|nr:O-antigen ligase family protein [Salinibacterium sp. PAMC 21357]
MNRGRGVGAATMLTVYIVLLLAWPSFVTITRLGSLGRPSLIWGLFLLFWWVLSRLQARPSEVKSVPQPVRYAVVALVVVALVSFAAAMLRGQPADQISPAMTALFRLASWAGVFFVAMDGVRTHADAAKLVRRLGVGAAVLAALGLAQFATGQTLLDWTTGIPGLTVDIEGVATRGPFTRAAGTAIHPLEYATAVVASLPLVIAAAASGGFRSRPSRNAGWWWAAVAVITIASVIAVSRSAIIGLAVAVIFALPAVPSVFRWVIGVGGGILALVVLAAVPGLLGTIVALFAGASDDASTQSRVGALSRVPEFISSSPLIGQGFGTFLPRYYIFDNAWVLLLVELGFIGALCFALLVVFAVGSAYWASKKSPFTNTKAMSKAIAASMITIAVLMIFFDGLSFTISAGLLFFMAGMAAAMRRVAFAQSEQHEKMKTAPRTSSSGVPRIAHRPEVSDG